MEVLAHGIIHYVSSELLIASIGNNLYRSDDSGENWIKWCVLSVGFRDSLMSRSRWLSRLTRKEVHHVIKINDRLFACFAFDQVYLIEAKTGKTDGVGSIEGSRPLKVCSNGERIYYGVYTNNPERKPVKIFAYSLENDEWIEFHTFRAIRHIHGVFWDKYSSKLWVTTGDLDLESIIWRFDNGNEAVKIVAGSQQTRAVDLLFTEKSIFYASDAPNDPNYIYRLDRQNGRLEPLQKVGGPIFYGRKEGDWLFFSTVVEPSEVNRTDVVELWGSSDKGSIWRKLHEFPKDTGHMKLFQYGQIRFPTGPGDGKYLWFTPYATQHDHKIMRNKLLDF